MIIVIDIGNTTISMGAMKTGKVLGLCHIETNLSQRELKRRIAQELLRIKNKYANVEAVVVCSVVPKTTQLLSKIVKEKAKINLYIIGKNIKVPIRNKYRVKSQVGQDRLVGAYAAKCLYGQPLIIIDFGTAITFDIVSAKGDYEGGLIIPGIRLSAESLFQKTAMLPRIDEIKIPRNIIGKDTKGSILSGIFYGYGTMCCGIIDVISRKLKGRPKVIVTGGHTSLICL